MPSRPADHPEGEGVGSVLGGPFGDTEECDGHGVSLLGGGDRNRLPLASNLRGPSTPTRAFPRRAAHVVDGLGELNVPGLALCPLAYLIHQATEGASEHRIACLVRDALLQDADGIERRASRLARPPAGAAASREGAG